MDKFTDIVVSWAPREILDDNLYQNQVEKIPETFDSVDQYLGSYVFPLLEETRADLASAMEAVHVAPFAEVTSLRPRESKPPGKPLYSVNVDSWRNEINNRGTREPYRTLPGDVFLLCDLKPQADSDVHRAGRFFTLACATFLAEGDSGACASFKLRTSERVEVAQGKPLYLVYLSNLITHRRIWNALSMRKNTMIIDKVLANKNDLEGDCDFCPLECSAELAGENLDLFSELNESQLEAVSTSLSKAECNHKPSVDLVWGPPGTGKTKTLSILVFVLMKMKVRTVVCTPTNVAITELASRVIALVKSSFETESKCSLWII